MSGHRPTTDPTGTRAAQIAGEIRSCPALADFSDAELHDVASWAAKVRPRSGEDFIHEGESRVDKQGLFLLTSGTVEVVKRGSVIAEVAAPSVFGEMELLTRMSPSASVRAKGEVTLYWISRERLEALQRSETVTVYKLLANFGRVLAHRLRAADEKLAEIAAGSDAKHEELSTLRAKIMTEWQF